MTDGIVKEVINKFLEEHYDKGGIRYRTITIASIQILQQELIEKIKQSLEYHEGCYHIQRGCSLKTDLIGDNQ